MHTQAKPTQEQLKNHQNDMKVKANRVKFLAAIVKCHKENYDKHTPAYLNAFKLLIKDAIEEYDIENIRLLGIYTKHYN